ncbi:lipid A biosynthesis lauroyl acyltransferase [Hydrogenimonas thermophila]|uniref:KDO2-lipid IV(A) lauroyltransferase n=1 Tax=Hydrogenimonas thermophila TaxID=223786 RepID=A0A1I5U4E8_9BACT|nr:lipid A biosynthesis lauroyl acyltransferase [Hydrogenimonas thermophila]SFP89797.1 KDO2-lipid IV(A) lauroyltransferase [Hydrogenimonas thermophila]
MTIERVYILVFRSFQWFVLNIPKFIRKPIMNILSFIIYLFDKRHRNYALANLDLAFGDSMDKKEKKAIAYSTYKNMLYNIADFIKNQGASKEDIIKKVKFENEDILFNIKQTKQPAIFITAHYGNWELLSLALATQLENGLSIVGRPLDSKVMDKILKQNREQFNIRLISKYGALRSLMREIKKGRNIGLLVDQSVKQHEGIEIEFFGHKATHITSAALLARKFKLPIIPVFITTQDHNSYTLTFYPAIYTLETDDMNKDIRKSVEAQAKITEDIIRKKPDEWFWQHRRWKEFYPEIYKKA